MEQNSFSFSLPHITPTSREALDKNSCIENLNPWKAQTIVFEILQTHFLTNKPGDLGYSFTQVYDTDEHKSQIALELSHIFKGTTPAKRPAVYVYRGPANYGVNRTLGQKAGYNVPEAEVQEYTKITMPITVACIAGPVGFVEQFADYVKYPFLYFWDNIQKEYCFYRFRLESISEPEQFSVDAKDTFIVKLNISTEFYDTWAIQQDALRLKTVSTSVYFDETKKPLENQ